MGYENEFATTSDVICVDVETAGLPNAADFLEPVQAAKNLVDPAKIAADIEKRTAERDEKLALDWNVGRIVALGFWTEQHGFDWWTAGSDMSEAEVLRLFWLKSKGRTIIGFNIKGFDLRFLVQRSRYLGVPYPQLNFSKYDRKGIHDLYLDLTFNDGTYDQGAMRRTLKAFAKRFGLPVQDDINGADIPSLVAAGDWPAIEAHVRSDVELTVALARKLGVIRTQPQPEAAGVR